MSEFAAMMQRLDSRLDSKYSAFLEKQLEFVKTQTYDVKYPALKARLFMPVSAQIPQGAATHLYRQWDDYGKARVISNYGDDFPKVGTGVKEFSGTIKSIGASYSYSVEDLRRSAFSGAQLDSRLARAARNAIEFELDELAAFGHKDSNLLGFLNNPHVSVEKSASWFGAQAKSPRQIMDDLAAMVTKMVETTNEIHAPDTILLPTKHFAYIAQTPISEKSETTILKSFLANSPYIQGIDSWQKLNGKAVIYKRSPEILELEIPQEFEQFPPQPRNMEFVINCHAKFAGVTMYYPKAVSYLEGI